MLRPKNDTPPMPKDPTPRPPYFMPPAEERVVYGKRGEGGIRKLLETSPPHATSMAESINKHLARAVATNLDGEVQAFGVDQFRRLTERWHRLGIGPARALYYMDFLSGGAYDPDALDYGGFPVYPGTAVGYLLVVEGLRTTPAAREWLKHDAYLVSALHAMGVRLSAVEDAIARAFRLALPPPYQPLVAEVPDALAFVLWKHDLEKWQYFERHGKGIADAVDSLSRRLWKTPYGPEFDPVLDRLRAVAAPAEWTEWRGVNMAPYCQREFPIRAAVCRAAANALWSGVKEQDTPPELPDALRSVYDASVNNARQPDEFWMLLADVLFHLPIAEGLPSLRTYVDEAPRRIPARSWIALRSAVRRQERADAASATPQAQPSE